MAKQRALRILDFRNEAAEHFEDVHKELTGLMLMMCTIVLQRSFKRLKGLSTTGNLRPQLLTTATGLSRVIIFTPLRLENGEWQPLKPVRKYSRT